MEMMKRKKKSKNIIIILLYIFCAVRYAKKLNDLLYTFNNTFIMYPIGKFLWLTAARTRYMFQLLSQTKARDENKYGNENAVLPPRFQSLLKFSRFRKM